MNVDFRHIITLIIASLISFTANADMSHIASRSFSDIFATTDRYHHCGHAVQKALNDGGIESNEQNDIENHSSYMWLPTTIFINIIFQNPHGEYIKRE